MNFADHAPAHFHAWYNEYKVIVSIKDGIVKGEMPGRALKMILEWLEQHKEELMENWEKAQKGDPLEKNFAPHQKGMHRNFNIGILRTIFSSSY